MPERMDREIHFDITYVVDLITQMSKYDVKCVVDYDKLSTTKKISEAAAKEGRGAGKSSGGKPTKALVCFQWNAGKCSKKGCKYAHECSKSPKMASLLLTYLTVWNSVDLSEHGVSLEALREFESSTVEMGAAVPKVTEFADRWAIVFQHDPAVDDLVRSVSLGAGWKFNPDSVVMSGKNYVKEGFDFKVDKHHQEELTARRVVPVPEGWARADSWGRSRGQGSLEFREGHFMVKVDIESAYRHFPIGLQYLPYHTYRWKGEPPEGEVFEAEDTDSRFVEECLRLYNGQQVVLNRREVSSSHFSVDASTETGMGDALSRQEWQLFYQLRTEWLRDSVWRKDTDDWILEILQHFLECKRRQNVGTAACFVIPVWPIAGFFKFIMARPTVFFPLVAGDHLDTECHLGSLTSGKAVACTETELRDLEDGLTHYTMNAVAGNTRSTYETGGKQYCRFAVWADFWPVFPATERTLSLWVAFLARTVKHGTINVYLSAARSLHLELGFTLPGLSELPYLRRVLRGIKRLKGNPKVKKLGLGTQQLVQLYFHGGVSLENVNDLYCWLGCLLAFRACLRKANVTAKKENAFSGTGVMLKTSIRFEGRDKMRVMVSFSKTNQFSERTHETPIHEVPGLTAFRAVSVARRAMALNQLPGGTDAPLLRHTKAGGQQVALTHSVFYHWLKTKVKTAGLQPER
ncbi:hypothetical protein CYMTET_12490 [Cymbomonas tetramitiformis]|uniref:C3H1-type domain-containing protein n=1 Tax=Cymbomonas tetramitiformis TaxID=36881 RepID=A0AAE0GKD6_9CHLO|nr:hypothetical protein CYMTET_12490 [Cymbomonas tetramitiformis]